MGVHRRRGARFRASLMKTWWIDRRKHRQRCNGRVTVVHVNVGRQYICRLLLHFILLRGPFPKNFPLSPRNLQHSTPPSHSTSQTHTVSPDTISNIIPYLPSSTHPESVLPFSLSHITITCKRASDTFPFLSPVRSPVVRYLSPR